MKTIWISVALLIASSLHGAISADAEFERTGLDKYECVQSPSRRYIALSGVGLTDVSPSIRMRVRLLVVGLVPVRVRQILPWLHRPYVVIWGPNDVLLVCGRSDELETPEPVYEISAHRFDATGAVEHRKATDDEKKRLIGAFEAKHGFRPEPIAETERPFDAFPLSTRLWLD